MNQMNGSKLNKNYTMLNSQSLEAIATKDRSQTPEAAPTSNGSQGGRTGTNGKTATNGNFDQPVILRQSATWSRAILWTIVGVTTFGIAWASIAKIEQAVPAQGNLEPQGAVKEIKAPVGGVVTEIHVEEGDRVEKGQRLLSLEPSATQAELNSLKQVRDKLIQENQFYRLAMQNPSAPPTPPPGMQLELSSELPSLIKSRDALFAENLFYQTQIDGDPRGVELTPEQRQRLRFATAELNSRIASAESEVEQLKKQLDQNQAQLVNSRKRLETEQVILDDLDRLFREGGFSKLQYRRQQSEVGTRRAEVQQLTDEKLRLELDIAQAKEQLENTQALTNKELTDLIAANNKQVNEINSRIDGIERQLKEAIVENEKQIAEIGSKLKQAELTLSYQELKAPVSGIVFDLQPNASGFVTNTTEPVLKIVPGNELIAKVYLTNKDIGFVEKGMPVDVRIDSYPFSEFGDVKGELVSIGSDALPPTEIRQYYSFPAKIRLKQQTLSVNDRTLPLQSGMTISANIKVRDRTVLSIFTDLFTDKVESLKTVR